MKYTFLLLTMFYCSVLVHGQKTKHYQDALHIRKVRSDTKSKLIFITREVDVYRQPSIDSKDIIDHLTDEQVVYSSGIVKFESRYGLIEYWHIYYGDKSGYIKDFIASIDYDGEKFYEDSTADISKKGVEIKNEKKQLIGIGNLIIDETTVQDLIQMVGIQLDTVKEVDLKEYYSYASDKNYLHEIVPTNYRLQGYRTLKVKELYAGDIELKEIDLLFLNDTLIQVSINNIHDEIHGAFIMNYGKPLVKISNQLVQCRYKLTGQLESLKETTTVFTWMNGKIRAIEANDQFYDSNCKLHFEHSLKIHNKIKYESYLVFLKKSLKYLEELEYKKKKERYKKI